MSVEEEVLLDVKESLDNKIIQATNEINTIQSRITNRAPAITEVSNRLEELRTANRQDNRELENLQRRLERITNLRDRLESGEVDIEIRRRR